MRRLLLEGDVTGRYGGATDSDAGYRLTMALAVGCSQPGRAWTPADFFRALLYTPTAGGAWARRLRERKGTDYAEAKLTAMLDRARQLVAGAPAITCRQDALEAIETVRQVVEEREWPGAGGAGSDLKNLIARLSLCERAGGLDHAASVRQLAEAMGCARATVEASNRRLVDGGWLVLLKSGSGKLHGSMWRLKIPDPERSRGAREVVGGGARVGRSPAAGYRGAGTVLATHTTDTRTIGSLMHHDAFHHHGHGLSGARILACLDPLDGIDVHALREATGLHRSTVTRRLRRLVDDGLVAELGGYYYLASALAGPARLHPDEDLLDHSAHQRGTSGRSRARRERHQSERAYYQHWLAERTPRRRQRGSKLVPDSVIDQNTGEILDERWRGWDLSDPRHPTFPTPAQAA
ncbi:MULTISPECIES: MarR family transcriptional regulator [unclassified Streptomyces]|uniref:MarR family transcriptional regulator n=1 Tax=unclassified Streptomyces TaxID=2593676 RepID=UPI001F02A19F|nr:MULTISPECIES: MarR family transcriptional regulator [unclassified Streptomyces]